MEQKKIGIIRGGVGEHYFTSLQKGAEIISFLKNNLADKYKVLDVLIDQTGQWHLNGLPILPADLLNRVDLLWNTSDQKISMTLQNFSIPTLGANVFSNLVQSNRELLKKHLQNFNLGFPRHLILPVYQEDFDGPRENHLDLHQARQEYAIKKAKEVVEKFGAPWLVRSLSKDKNIGIHLAKTFPELVEAIIDICRQKQSVVVEEIISGQTMEAHSVNSYRGEEIYTFPLVSSLAEKKQKIYELTKNLHQHFQNEPYLHFKFTLHPAGRIYLNEINTWPALEEESNLNKVCLEVGAKIEHLIEHLLEKTFKK